MNSTAHPTRLLTRTAVCLVLNLTLLLNPAGAARAAADAINTGYFGNVAIQGYDPVAYFTKGEATKGQADHTHEWLGAHWWFENEEHRQMFAGSPRSYAPQYGGHCATGMGVHGGRTTDIDPEAWVIVDGKLYLNYSKETTNLLMEGVVTVGQADANWENVLTARE